jgi:hypothetical protein
MLFTTTSIAVLGFASYASAHMKISKPVPYANAQLDNAPLNGDGSNYPCKMKFDTTTPATSMALGSTQPLEFIGGATHGGGSCQVSITYDNPPTKNSVFKVIHSIEGGCPVRNNPGNVGSSASAPGPDSYSFTIPTSLPTGKATLAWTWFNKVGNREMYMNCAPIAITGGTAKRTEEEDLIVRNLTQLVERDQNAFNALPNMFTANIKNIGNDACGTLEGFDIQFPQPGSSIDRPGAASHFGGLAGNCGAAAAPVPAPASPASTAPASGGGVFVTVAPGSPASPTAAPTKAPAAVPTSAAAPAPAPASSAAPAAPVSPAPVVSGSQTPGSTCSPEGQWNCLGTSFQRCAAGTWSVVQQMAAGTVCTVGQSANLDMKAAAHKRSIRFSSAHARRHIHARS